MNESTLEVLAPSSRQTETSSLPVCFWGKTGSSAGRFSMLLAGLGDGGSGGCHECDEICRAVHLMFDVGFWDGYVSMMKG